MKKSEIFSSFHLSFRHVVMVKQTERKIGCVVCAYVFFLLHGHEMGKRREFESHKRKKEKLRDRWVCQRGRPSSGLEHGEVRDYSNVIVVWQPRRSYS